MTKSEKSKVIKVWSILRVMFATVDYPEMHFPKGKENTQRKLIQEMWDIIDPMVCKMKPQREDACK